MPLQPPAGILWHSPGSACLFLPLLGQSHRLAVRTGASKLGIQCSSDTARSREGQLCQASTSGLFDLSCLQEFLPWGLAANSRAELPSGRFLPRSRWSGLCSHLDQLLGRQWWRWPTHFCQPTCLLNLPDHLLQCLCHLPRGWGAFGWGGVVHRRGGCLHLAFSFLAHLASHLRLLLSSLLLSSSLASLTRRARSFLVRSTVLPSLSFLGVVLVLAILFEKWKEKVVVKGNNYQEIQFGKQRKKQKVYIKIKSYMKITFSWDFTSVAILNF